MNKNLVIYHGQCRDGFCAAWVINMRLRQDGDQADFIAAQYGQAPPDCTGRDVIMADFSCPLGEMLKIRDEASSLVVLDHHKTAKEALEPLLNPGLRTPKFQVFINTNHSGAMLAWNWCNFPVVNPPWLVRYVEDRDLWHMKLPNSEAINAFIGTIPFTFEAWDAAWMDYIDELPLREGFAILAKIRNYVAEVKKNAVRIKVGKFDVPIVNAPQVDISELVQELSKGEPFAMGWWQRADGMFCYSLRSSNGFDVSEVAKMYGGGGHPAAAGFQLDRLLTDSANIVWRERQ